MCVLRLHRVVHTCKSLPMQTTLLTTTQAAERLQVSVPTLNRWVRQGRIAPAVQAPGVRGARLYDPADIDALAAETAA